MYTTIRQLATGFALGEGPVWCAQTQTLFFVDIEQKLCLQLVNDVVKIVPVPDMVGCVVPIETGVVAAVKNRLYRLDLPARTQTLLAAYPFADFLRFNDGKCDAAGRLWIGTMASDQAHPRAKGGGSLYCIERGSIVAQYDSFTIPNGMAWSADGKVLYHIDTPTQKIDAYDVIDGITLENKRTVAAFAAEEGAPDGMCIDADGNLWVALWGGNSVACVNPGTGERLEQIHLPEQYVSCCTFGGKELTTLFITTARDENGSGGSLWSIKTGKKGVLPYQYKEV